MEDIRPALKNIIEFDIDNDSKIMAIEALFTRIVNNRINSTKSGLYEEIYMVNDNSEVRMIVENYLQNIGNI